MTPGRYRDKAVKSKRGVVTNIEEYLQSGIDILDFRDLLLKHVVTNYHNPIIYKLSDKDIEKIDTLVKDKYSTWEWIYGYSPKYSLDCIYKTEIQDILFRIFVEDGIIKNVEVKGIYNNEKILLELPGLIKGVPHRESDLKEKTDIISELLSISKAEADKLIDSMF